MKVGAHKVVLASASPFFMELLKRMKHSQPLIYLRGVRSADLVAMVDFLYLGEANILQKDLDTFLTLAEDLKLNGLSGSYAAGQGSAYSRSNPASKKKKKPLNQQSKKLAINNDSGGVATDSKSTLDSSESEQRVENKVATEVVEQQLELSEEPCTDVKVEEETVEDQIRCSK